MPSPRGGKKNEIIERRLAKFGGAKYSANNSMQEDRKKGIVTCDNNCLNALDIDKYNELKYEEKIWKYLGVDNNEHIFENDQKEINILATNVIKGRRKRKKEYYLFRYGTDWDPIEITKKKIYSRMFDE